MILLIPQRIVCAGRRIACATPLGTDLYACPDSELDAAAISDHFDAVRRRLSVRECPGRA